MQCAGLAQTLPERRPLFLQSQQQLTTTSYEVVFVFLFSRRFLPFHRTSSWRGCLLWLGTRRGKSAEGAVSASRFCQYATPASMGAMHFGSFFHLRLLVHLLVLEVLMELRPLLHEFRRRS